MRVGIICLLLLSLASVWLALPAGAQIAAPINIGIPYVIGPCFTYAAPFSNGAYILNEFNSNTLVHTDTESLAISLGTGGPNPFAGGFTISPVIAQTSADTLVMDKTYFFNDFISG